MFQNLLTEFSLLGGAFRVNWRQFKAKSGVKNDLNATAEGHIYNANMGNTNMDLNNYRVDQIKNAKCSYQLGANWRPRDQREGDEFVLRNSSGDGIIKGSGRNLISSKQHSLKI
jgi:hypothetical protein